MYSMENNLKTIIKNKLISSYFEKHVLNNTCDNFDYIIKTFILLKSDKSLLSVANDYYKLLTRTESNSNLLTNTESNSNLLTKPESNSKSQKNIYKYRTRSSQRKNILAPISCDVGAFPDIDLESQIKNIIKFMISVIKYNILNDIDSKVDIIELIISMNYSDKTKEHLIELENVLCDTNYNKLITNISNLFLYQIEIKPEQIDTDLKPGQNINLELPNTESPAVHTLITYLDVKPNVFASELTYICEIHFNKITSYHFINHLLDKSVDTNSTINFLIKLFEKVSNLVSYEIISADINKQPFIVEYFIKVAQELNNIGNYHMLFSVLSGLNNTYVTKIQYLWKNKSYLNTLAKLNNIISFNRNFQNYRAKINFKSDDPVKKIQPSLPYIGLILSDLIHLLEYNVFDFDSNTIDESIIKTIYEYINTIDTYNYQYQYVSNPDVNFYILNLKTHDLTEANESYLLCNLNQRSQSFDHNQISKKNSRWFKKNSSSIELTTPRPKPH